MCAVFGTHTPKQGTNRKWNRNEKSNFKYFRPEFKHANSNGKKKWKKYAKKRDKSNSYGK